VPAACLWEGGLDEVDLVDEMDFVDSVEPVDEKFSNYLYSPS